MCAKLGGHIIGIRHKRIKDLSGGVHDDKSYEILREDFLRATQDAKTMTELGEDECGRN